jgi:hypothetical protein
VQLRGYLTALAARESAQSPTDELQSTYIVLITIQYKSPCARVSACVARHMVARALLSTANRLPIRPLKTKMQCTDNRRATNTRMRARILAPEITGLALIPGPQVRQSGRWIGLRPDMPGTFSPRFAPPVTRICGLMQVTNFYTVEVKVDSTVALEYRAAGFSLRATAKALGPGVSYGAVYRALRRAEGKHDRRPRSGTLSPSVARTPEYMCFENARARCNRLTHPRYKDYGGRGIQFRFKSFEEFLAELGPRPSPQHSPDRFPNNDGHYEIGNVRWALSKEQQANTRPALKRTEKKS